MDDITTGELGRRLTDIQAAIGAMRAEVVGRLEYGADQRSAEHRFADIAADLEDVRRQHTEDMRAVHQRISDAAKVRAEHRMTWRTVLVLSIPPTAATLIAGLLTYLATRGGH